MNLYRRIVLPWIAFGVFVVATVWWVERIQFGVQERAQADVRYHQTASATASELRILSQERWGFALAFDGGSIDATVDRIAESEARTENLVTELANLRDTTVAHLGHEGFVEREAELLASYREIQASLPVLFRDWLHVRGSGDVSVDARWFVLRQQFSLAQAQLDDLVIFHQQAEDIALSQAEARTRRASSLMYVALILLILIVAAFSVFETVTIVRPLAHLSEAAQARTEDRPGTFELGNRRDEIGVLSRALTAMVASMEDARQQAVEQQKRFETVLQAVPQGLAVIDDDGKVVLHNDALPRLFRHASSDLTGQPLSSASPGLAEAVGDRVESSELSLVTTELERQDGSELFAELDIFPIEPRATGHRLIVLNDASDRLALQKAEKDYYARLEADVRRRTWDLERRTRDLESANRDLEAFSYSVSHDLRAPLRAIDGFIEILTEEHVTELDDEARRMFDIVQQNARKMGVLIDDILAFSRAGRLELKWAQLAMKDVIGEAWRMLSPEREDRNVELRMADLPSVAGDARAVRQIMHNLLANALKFTRERNPAIITIDADELDGFVRFSVRDNGVGFKPEYAGHLFVLFQRLHGMDEFAGTGVGLAVVKRFVDKHGGQVEASATPGNGAEFAFTLPIEAPLAPDEDQARTEQRERPEGVNV